MTGGESRCREAYRAYATLGLFQKHSPSLSPGEHPSSVSLAVDWFDVCPTRPVPRPPPPMTFLPWPLSVPPLKFTSGEATKSSQTSSRSILLSTGPRHSEVSKSDLRRVSLP